MQKKFSHLTDDGSITMVDVGHKNNTQRIAIVQGQVHLNKGTLQLLQQKALPKGDVLATAKIAGIMAAKKTAELIPLCHPLSLSFADVRFEIEEYGISLECEVRLTGQTGVEMEALIGAQIAAATIYDMCKAVQKDISITNMQLVYKSGGKSGTFCSKNYTPPKEWQ